MLCEWANAPIKGQHMILWVLLLCPSPPSCWTPSSPEPPRLHRDWADWTSLDIVESVVVVINPTPPALLSSPTGVVRLHSFLSFSRPFFPLSFFPYFFLMSSPRCCPRPSSDSLFTKIRFTRLHSIWLHLHLNLFPWNSSKLSRYWIGTYTTPGLISSESGYIPFPFSVRSACVCCVLETHKYACFGSHHVRLRSWPEQGLLALQGL